MIKQELILYTGWRLAGIVSICRVLSLLPQAWKYIISYLYLIHIVGLSYLICTYPHFIILIDKPVLFYSSQLYTSLVLLHGYVKEITHTGLARYSDNCAVNTEHGVQKSGLSYARSRELVDKKIIGKDLPAAMLNCSFYPLAAMLPSKSYSY